MANASLHSSRGGTTSILPHSARVKLKPLHVDSKLPRLPIGNLPCRYEEPRFSERRDRDLSDTRVESDGREKWLCHSLRSAIESAMLPNRAMRAASRLLGILEARQALAMSQAIDVEVLQTVHAEVLKLRSLHSSTSPKKNLRFGPTLSTVQTQCGDFEIDELLSEEPWKGCEDIVAEELFYWFNESLQPSVWAGVSECHALPQGVVRLRPALGEDYEKLGSGRASLSSASTASTTSGAGRLSTASTSILSNNSSESSLRASICGSSRSSVMSGMRNSDTCMDFHEKSAYSYSKKDDRRLCHSARGPACSETSKSWKQMWHQRLFSARCALSARGERSDHLREFRGLVEDRFLNDVG